MCEHCQLAGCATTTFVALVATVGRGEEGPLVFCEYLHPFNVGSWRVKRGW